VNAKWLLAVVLVASACAAPEKSRAWRALDLDRPGAMAALERENPAHFATVRKIVREAPEHPFRALPDWLRTEFGASNVEALLFGSAGQATQARLTFTLDRRDYTKLIPAR